MRRQILVGSLLLALFFAVQEAAVAEERINLAYISPNASATSVLWVAKEAGLYKKYGLDASLIYIEGTPKALMALMAGDLQLTHGTGPAVVTAKLQGADVTMIMGFEVYLPYYLIAVPKIQRIEELKGKVGSNHSAATSADFAMRLGLRGLGFDPDRDVTLRVVGATNLRMMAMQQGMAQFTVISNSDLDVADKMGFKVLADLAGKRIPYPHTGVITSHRFLKEHRDTALRFGRAVLEAIQYMRTHKAETIAVLKKYTKMEESLLEQPYAYFKTAIPDLPYPTVEGMKTFLAEYGRTKPEVLKADPNSFVDMSIVKALEDEGFVKRLKQKSS